MNFPQFSDWIGKTYIVTHKIDLVPKADNKLIKRHHVVIPYLFTPRIRETSQRFTETWFNS